MYLIVTPVMEDIKGIDMVYSLILLLQGIKKVSLTKK